MDDKNQFSKEDHFLLGHLKDCYQEHVKTGKTTASPFLDECEQKVCTSFLGSQKIPYSVLELNPLCTKKIIYFGEEEHFATIYEIDNSSLNLRHQDVLGTLFGLGLTKEVLGDIFVEQKKIVFAVLNKVVPLIDNELKQIGNKVISLRKINEIILEEVHEEVFTIFVSSLRMDSILSRIIPCSRKVAIDYLKEHKVLCNYQEAKNANQILKEGDILSIRHVGKFRLGQVLGNSKSGKIRLEVIKYR